MLNFIIGLGIGFLIISPVIALVLIAGLMSRKPKDLPRKAPADVLQFDLARSRAKMHGKAGLTA
ncbi:hypothetical protein [Mangrovicoccus ximenensis]|uniref:hypothetical protein n=1 Tax=Mangrovicoccus ximenensis TaxID=1911570 RepID=UPI000D331680|nr:hypothetical protein [Mangrovicoccus ximenensis]